jgi:hypothetical protein
MMIKCDEENIGIQGGHDGLNWLKIKIFTLGKASWYMATPNLISIKKKLVYPILSFSITKLQVERLLWLERLATRVPFNITDKYKLT